MEFFQHQSVVEIGQILASALLTLPMAINREQNTRIMGLRTFPLVAMGTCAVVLIARSFLGDSNPDAEARIVQGILSGIGFVGGGAILKHDDRVKGTECAAGIWVTGGIAIGVAYERYLLVLFLSLATFLAVRFLSGLKKTPESE